MKKFIAFIFSSILLAPNTGLAQSSSLDELYRDIVKSDNQGYLPMFVKNRNVPDFLVDENIPAELQNKKPDIEPAKDEITEINFINERQLRDDAIKAKAKKWQDTITAIQENRITPVELEEVEEKVKENNPQAIEILAFMNARGYGIKQDLIKAFHLYKKASTLRVAGSEKNMAIVYRSMTRIQKESLTSTDNVNN